MKLAMRRSTCWGLLCSAMPLSLATAQTPAGTPTGTPAAVVRAAGTITAADLRHHVEVLAADSMFGRATPSLDLERTAAYLVAQFRRQGLDASSIGYRVPGHLGFDPERSMLQIAVALTNGGRPIVSETGDSVRHDVVPDFTSTAMYFAREVGPPTVGERVSDLVRDLPGSNQVIVLAGRYTAASVPETALHDKVVLYIPFVTADSATRHQMVARLYAASAGVIVLSDLDSARFVAAARRDQQQPVQVVDKLAQSASDMHMPFALMFRTDTIANTLRLAGVDVARFRTDSTRVLRDLPGTSVRLVPAVEPRRRSRQGQNVVALLPGTDSVLRKSYVVISAHMDAGGVRPGQPDSVDRGADDNASGTAGLLALAQAFNQPGARPRRSLLFLATSGTTGGTAWGSWAYATQESRYQHLAVLNLDRLGGQRGDSIWIDGMYDVDLGERPEWIAAQHPELGLAVVDGGTVVNPDAEYFPFVKVGLPTVAFRTDPHAEPGARANDVGTLDLERTARIVQLVFYVGQKLANAEQLPRWTPAGRGRKRGLGAATP